MLPALAANAGYSGSERYTQCSATVPNTDLAGSLELLFNFKRKRC